MTASLLTEKVIDPGKSLHINYLRYIIENGFGLRQWDNLDVYKGNYKNGKRHGHGHLIMRNEQEEYEGTRLKTELPRIFFGVISMILDFKSTILNLLSSRDLWFFG